MTFEELQKENEALKKENEALKKENAELKEELNQWKPKKVEQYSLDNTLINTFPTITSAAKSLYGNASCIRACLRGDSKSSYGYKWKYAKEDMNE